MITSDKMRLDGRWLLAHDAKDEGLKGGWYNGMPAQAGAVEATVPGYVHLYLHDVYGVAWYETKFDTSPLTVRRGGRYILRFEIADFLASVWVNGKKAGDHRGCEDPFEFDVTGLLREGENLLSVRVSKPWKEPVDGYRFEEIPHRNQCPTGILPGTNYNGFGLGGAVTLTSAPALRISDAYINGNVKTGCIDLEVTATNAGAPVHATLDVRVFDKRTGATLTQGGAEVDAAAGDSVIKLSVPVGRVHLWSNSDPYLYGAELVLSGGADEDRRSLRCGFRTFEVREDGYFYLNGKRIFVRCSHTGNFFAAGENMALDREEWQQDFVKAKACGLNMVRFISGAAFPDQLDYCDELGLMIYEEAYSSWLMQNGERDEELFREDLLTMIKRDRSHPSIVIWGILNETLASGNFSRFPEIARDSIGCVRELDETRLVLYSSGRFDGNSSVGSVCNPYSHKWECLWNEEGDGGVVGYDTEDPGGFFRLNGDVHMYPKMPITDRDVRLIRTLGEKPRRPAFMSEYGQGSLFNTSWILRHYEQRKLDGRLPDTKMIRHMDEQFLRDLERYGLDGLYPFPVDLLRDSERLHARQRTICFDLVRSNPWYNGYSITGLLDHSICGEGLWTIMREFKPGIADALQNGLAPLRWCLFVDRRHAYCGRPFTIEGVLANEDVLEQRDYPVGVCITGEQGVVWRKELTLSVTPGLMRGFSVPVFKEQVCLDLPEGRYELHAEVLEGAAAAENVSVFYLSDDRNTAASVRRIAAAGLNDAAQALLAEKLVEVVPLADADEDERYVVVIGEPAESEREEVFEKALAMAEKGSRVFVASRYALALGEDYGHFLPVPGLDSQPHTRASADWLYHKEYIAKRHEYFTGLPCGRIMDWEYYGQVTGGAAFNADRLPDETAAACVGPGNINEDGYCGGFNLGTYNTGKGAVTVTTFKLLENIGDNPAADRLFINILNTENERL